MKKSIFILLTMMGLTSVHAEDYDYPYLVFQQNDGTAKSVAVESLVLTIANGQLVATNSDGTQQFSLSSLSQMYFSADATGIEQTETPIAANSPVEVFTLTGVSLGKFENLQTAKTALQKGIYVMKSESGTLKISVK